MNSLKKQYLIHIVGRWHRLFRHQLVKNKRILFVQLSALGDACTLIPLCKLLEEQEYELTVVCRAGLEMLWSSFIHCSVLPIEEPFWNHLQKLNQLLGKEEFEAVICTSITPVAAFISSLPKTSCRLGMAPESGKMRGQFLYTNRYRPTSHEHVWNRFAGLIRLWQPDFPCPKREDAGSILESPAEYRGVLIHPGGKWKPRRWPADRYAALVRKLRQTGYDVRLIIHQSEEDLLSFFQETDLSGASVILTQTVHDLIDAVAGCDLFIGNDSGPMHLTAMLGKPGIILWGPGDFERIRPLGQNIRILMKPVSCRPCKQYQNQEVCERGDNICLKEIEVEEVLCTVESVGKR